MASRRVATLMTAHSLLNFSHVLMSIDVCIELAFSLFLLLFEFISNTFQSFANLYIVFFHSKWCFPFISFEKACSHSVTSGVA